MQVAESQLLDVPVLVITGEIDHGNAAALRQTLEEALDRSAAQHVLLDLRSVGYIDSGGLSSILWAVRRLREHGWVGVVGPNPDVHRLLDIVGLGMDDGFRVFTDDQEALAAVKGLPAT
jgi:stage II sporulation protein AA (anti-sigma F factor antagonist)